MPQDIAKKVLTPAVLEAEPALSRLDRVGEQWLGAINLFVKGAKLPTASSFGPWQIVAVDYSAGVPDFGDQYGDGTITQWFSIDLQTWDYPGLVHGKTAKECTKQEFLDEILAHR